MESKSATTIDIEDFINRCVSACASQKYAFAAFVLPGKNAIEFLAGPETPFNGDVEASPPGFIFSPFNDKAPVFHIEARYHSSLDTTSNDADLSRLYKRFADLIEMKAPGVNTLSTLPDIPGSGDYIYDVQKAIRHIQAGHLKKVVIARNKVIDLPENASPGRLFRKLSTQFQNSFRSLIHSGRYGTWIGASPEMLVSIDDNVFKTVALAGTQRLLPGQSVTEAVWKQKEIEEQALVSRYIISCFKSIRLREFEEEGPKTIAAGHLLHLKTVYTVNLSEISIPSLGSQMLRLLHPTSAVGGMPRQEAYDFIRATESFDRQLFAGYIGPVNLDRQTSLFVNIRCARLYEGRAVLYAGAGITIESDPEKELVETDIKMNVIASVLHSEN